MLKRFAVFAAVLAMACGATSVASARVPSGDADVAFTLQRGLANQDLTDRMLANAGEITDPGICKLYPASGNPGDPVMDQNTGYVSLVDNHVIYTIFAAGSDVVVDLVFRTCDDEPGVRNVAHITNLASFELVVKPAKPHSCVLKVSNPKNTLPAELWFGTFDNGKPDGIVVVNAGATKTINVVRTKLDFYTYIDTGDPYDYATQAYAGYGQLRHIKVTKSCKQHATGIPPGASVKSLAARS